MTPQHDSPGLYDPNEDLDAELFPEDIVDLPAPNPRDREDLPSMVGQEHSMVILLTAIAGLLFCGPLSIIALVLSERLYRKAQREGVPLEPNIKLARILATVGLVLWVVGTILLITVA